MQISTDGIGCSHGRALDYFTESIITRLGFWAVKCMHLNFVPGIGFYFGEDFTNTILVGEYAMPPRYAQYVFFRFVLKVGFQ